MFSSLFPRGFINNAVPQFFASESLSGATSRHDYQTTHNTIFYDKKQKPNQVMCFPPTQTHSQILSHTHQPVPRRTHMSLLMQQNEETGRGKTAEEEYEVMSGTGGGEISLLGLSNYL